MFHVSQPEPLPSTVRVSRESFPDAELGKDHVEQIFYIRRTHDPPQSIRCQTQLFSAQFLGRPLIDGALQMPVRRTEQLDMAQT